MNLSDVVPMFLSADKAAELVGAPKTIWLSLVAERHAPPTRVDRRYWALAATGPRTLDQWRMPAYVRAGHSLRPPERRTEMMFFGHRAPDAQSELANATQLGLLATPQRTRRPAVAVTEALLTENT